MKTLEDKENNKWRNQVRGQRVRREREHQEWLNKITSQWKEGEWEKFKTELYKLSLLEVRFLANITGMKFVGGNSKITDKEEFILILDEADKGELISEYNKLIKKRK